MRTCVVLSVDTLFCICRQVLQWAQWYNEPTPSLFAFNYGPEYNISNIRSPVYLFSGGADALAAPKDIELTRRKLTRAGVLVGDHHTADYSHMDFIWDLGAKSRVYGVLLGILDKEMMKQQ